MRRNIAYDITEEYLSRREDGEQGDVPTRRK
jgi:hypothetical protein